MTDNATLAEMAANELFQKSDFKSAMRLIETNPSHDAESYFGSNLWQNANISQRIENINQYRKELKSNNSSLPSTAKKRLLGIYDLRTYPWTLGDILIYNVVLMTIHIIENTEAIDFIWILDREHPARFDQGITQQNCWHFLSTLFPLIRINPFLENIHFMNNRSLAEDFIVSSSVNSVICPPYRCKGLPGINSYQNHMPFLLEAGRVFGELPPLISRIDTKARTRQMLRHHLPNPQTIPVAVHLRRSSHCAQRNFQTDAWQTFFKYCLKKHKDISFLLIGSRRDAFIELSSYPNAHFVKDWGTSAEDDMAIIEICPAFVASNSGPSAMATWGLNPFRIFNYVPTCEHSYIKHGEQFPWLKPNQKTFWEPETDQTLISEFESMMQGIDLQAWNENFHSTHQEDISVLSRSSSHFGNMLDYNYSAQIKT